MTIPTKYDKDKILKFYDSDNPDEIQFLTDRFKVSSFSIKIRNKSTLSVLIRVGTIYHPIGISLLDYQYVLQLMWDNW